MAEISAEELERLKDRTKVNFFQVEKTLAEFDTRMDNFEKNLRKMDASLEKSSSASSDLAAKFRARKEDGGDKAILKKFDELDHLVRSNLVELSSLERRLEDAEGVLGPKGTIEKRLSEINSALLAFEKSLQILQKKPAAGVRAPKSDFDKAAVEAFIEERIKPVKDARIRLSELEERLENFDKSCADFQALRTELAEDKKLYMELRSAVLASIEKFSKLEKDFSVDMDALRELERSVEGTRQYNEQVSAELKVEMKELREESELLGKSVDTFKISLRKETSDEIAHLEKESRKFEGELKSETQAEIARLEEEKNRFEAALKTETRAELARLEGIVCGLEKSFDKFKRGVNGDLKQGFEQLHERSRQIESMAVELNGSLTDEISKRLEDFEDGVMENIDATITRHAKRVNAFGEQVKDLRAEFDYVKQDVVEKTIDDEMNKLLIVLSEKMKGLATVDDFEALRSELNQKVDRIRSPETRPLESRIYCLEEDLAELKKLLRGVSQRLPVVVE